MVAMTTTNNSPEKSPFQLRAALVILLALLVTGLYWPVTKFAFINYDDQDYVTENSVVHAGLTWAGVRWAFTTSHAGNWHPLTWLSHLLDGEWYGSDAGGHHATSLILHALNAALLFGVVHRITGATWRSFFVAALFAVHPLRVESVAWVSERKDVLSTFFGLLCLLAYARFARSGSTLNPQPSTPVPPSAFRFLSSGSYWLALLCFALGLMSKPVLVTLPFALLLLDVWPLRRLSLSTFDFRLSTLNRLVLEKIPFLILTLASCVITYTVQQSAGAVAATEAVSIGARLQNAIVSYVAYLGKTFWPEKLAVLYPYPDDLAPGLVIGAFVLLVGITAVAVAGRNTKTYLLVGWLWYLGTLVPMIGLVQVGQQALADRYTYLPGIGILIMVVWGVADWRAMSGRPKWALVAGAAVLVGLLGLKTRQQLQHWRNSEALFSHTLAVTRNNAVAHYSLGSALAVQGRVAEAIPQFREALRLNPQNVEALNDLGLALVLEGAVAEGIGFYQQAIAAQPGRDKPYFNLARALILHGQKAEAVPIYRRLLEMNPNHPAARLSLANLLAELGRTEEAQTEFEILLRENPNAPEVYWHYGNLRQQQGDPAAALEQYLKALPLAPHNADLHDSLGLALAKLGQTDAAISYFRRAIQLQPTAEFYCHLALALNLQGQTEEAIAAYREALLLMPDYVEALNDLAWLLATHPSEEIQNGSAAIPLAERAVALSQRQVARFLGTLDAAYAAAGRFEAAIQTAQETIARARSEGAVAVAAAAEARRQLYQTKTPYRQTSAP
jgi:tetratricopeptide (TPR) repeat protein